MQNIRNNKEIRYGSQFRFLKVSQDEVLYTLKNVKDSKSHGYEDLSNKVLKLINGALAPSLLECLMHVSIDRSTDRLTGQLIGRLTNRLID